jgi:uncharacterized protein YecE (DUF72 family)
LKLWRGMTHYRKMTHCTRWLSDFGEVLRQLPAAQQGPLLVQLPPQQQRDESRLDAFLAELRQLTVPSPGLVAVEFRHASWNVPEVYAVLDRHETAICLHDMPDRGPVRDPNGVSLVYVRRHGPKGDYHGAYDTAVLEADGARIRQWRDEGRTIYVYFNNDYDGHAVHDAQRLAALV